MKLRPSVQRFAEAMERKLRTHDMDRGEEGWMDDYPEDFLPRIFEEWLECHDALIHGHLQKAKRESVDIANFAMMLFDTARL